MICGAILILNLTLLPWDNQLPQVINTATKTCQNKYKKCLKKVTRVGEREFSIICEKPPEE